MTPPARTDLPPHTVRTPPPAVDYPPDGSVRPVGRYVWEPVETTPLPAAPAPGLRDRSVAVVGGRETAAYAISTRLSAAGAHVHRLAPPRAGDPADDDGVPAFLAAAGGRLDGIVDLGVPGPFTPTGPDVWEPAFRQTLRLLQAVHADWSAETDATRLFYLPVTRLGGLMGFGPAGEPPPIEQPLGGLWAGLAKGLPREIPNCNIRVLDLGPEDHAATAESVCRELYRWGPFEIGHHHGRRYTLRARPAQPGPPRTSLAPGDTVVMSGGGRGIGFALARALAADFGVRVIVSGRSALPDERRTPEVALSAADFRAYRDDRLRAAATARALPATRAALAKLADARELWSNLAAARADGLHIEYAPCDVTDPEQTAQLLARAGDRLAGVVHNAGLDVPTRLPHKTPETIAAVVAVKIRGFLNLLRALPAGPPAFFCNVGSLTGRWGGMVGQLDYGAANEGLSRLGLWAARTTGLPVSTVCWPTWERLGMITNYEATLRYMSAVDVDEALHHWRRELLSRPAGEVTFIGDVGPAMLPSVLRGYQQDSGLPGIERLATSRYFLGEPVRFHPHAALTTHHALRPAELPVCDDFRIGGTPALPISLALELLHAAGAWVQPEGSPDLHPAGTRDVTVTLPALRLPQPETRLTRTAAGAWSPDGTWRVAVELTAAGRHLASAELVYAPAGRRATGTAAEPPEPPPPAEGAPSWTGHVVPLAEWRYAADGTRRALAHPPRPADWLLTSPAPTPALPLGALENVFREAWAARSTPGPTRLTVAHLAASPDAAATPLHLTGTPDAADWTATPTDAPAPALRIAGLRLS
ncbi:SDR family NAD(P)-dependent oxidoreductase [Streptomyces sp. NRRL F-5123]|uniref:SDR family NAD(P)-dependent oxidoreductase n=1 Tax=Streptomyces sp. NRRL F-5123 TaxID=1463856 RepID=UPI0005B95DFE|nr:SDR family NAD(P)-dependent oxidoreductase [Streptomyces sp. NRRL F-5123]